jgi:hypothetical protein
LFFLGKLTFFYSKSKNEINSEYIHYLYESRKEGRVFENRYKGTMWHAVKMTRFRGKEIAVHIIKITGI